jgi:hypothetical protein
MHTMVTMVHYYIVVCVVRIYVLSLFMEISSCHDSHLTPYLLNNALLVV